MASQDDKSKEVQEPKGELCSSKCKLTLCSWNVDGTAAAKLRQESLTKFFSDKDYDIVCLQEVTVRPDMKTFKQYFPSPYSDYEKVYQVEESSTTKKYSVVLYCKDKTVKSSTFDEDKFEKAYKLMEKKANFYRKIAEKNLREEADIKKLASNDLSDNERQSILEEVLDELDACKLEKIISRYRYKEKDGAFRYRLPKELLQPRMAVALLQTKNNIKFVVFSVHVPKNLMLPADFAYLFFDFLRKVEIDCPIVIAGDFNCDIRKVEEIEKFLRDFSVHPYELPSRRTRMIDHILTNLPSSQWHVSLGELSPQDYFEDPISEDKKYVTNHSPLAAKLMIEKLVNGASFVNEKSFEKASPSVKDESSSTPSDKGLTNVSTKVKEESSDT